MLSTSSLPALPRAPRLFKPTQKLSKPAQNWSNLILTLRSCIADIPTHFMFCQDGAPAAVWLVT
jgi:hypothetical protein